jgi:hypothetical protein
MDYLELKIIMIINSKILRNKKKKIEIIKSSINVIEAFQPF